MPDMKGAMTELMEENKRLKARCKMLRKLRHVVVVTVQEPNGNILRCFTLPHFVYEKGVDRLRFIKDHAKTIHNQTMSVMEVLACDTMAGFESEIVAMNQVDDQKEEDGIEDNR